MSARRKRQVDGIDARCVEGRVVHRGRHRVPDRDVRPRPNSTRRGGKSPKAELGHHPLRRHLARRHGVAGVGPARTEPRGEDAARQARLAHRDKRHAAMAGGFPAEGQERQIVAEPVRRHGDLDDLRARSPAWPRSGPGRSAGMPSKSCDDTMTPRPRRRATSGMCAESHSMSTYSAPSAAACSENARAAPPPPRRIVLPRAPADR